MTFMIKFARNSTAGLDLITATGEIVVGEFSETFQADLSYWREGEYEASWRENVERLALGYDRAALITSISDPRSANFVFWWPMYRIGQQVILQNHVLFLDELDGTFTPGRAHDFVPTRVNVNEEGEEISEWVLPISSFSTYLA